MTGVLLMAYGTPRSLDDVEAFYTHIRGGRAPSPDLIQSLRRRYQAVGGRTPLLDITQQQAASLEQALGPDYRVFVGMKHWRPYIGEAVSAMIAAGISEAVAMALAPHYSAMSVGAYFQAVDEAMAPIAFRKVRSWHLQPAYLQAVADQVRAASTAWTPDVVVFTAHSLPQRILAMDDPYVDQLQATASAIARLLGLERWIFSFQSAGATGDAWLGPDILQTIDRLAAEGAGRVLVAPIGFISDHLEILYDLDVQARQHATAAGLDLRRTESLNASPLLIQALAAAVHEAG